MLSLAVVLLASPLPVVEPGADWISIGRVERILAREGYRLVEIEADGDVWEGEATRHGKTWDFTMNPRSGRVITMEEDD